MSQYKNSLEHSETQTITIEEGPNRNATPRTVTLFEGTVRLPATNGKHYCTPAQWLYHDGTRVSAYGDKIIANTSHACPIILLHKELDIQLTTSNQVFTDNINYTNSLNSWCHSYDVVYTQATQREGCRDGFRVWEYEHTLLHAGRVITGYGIGRTVKEARNMADFAIMSEYVNKAKVQGEGEGSKESVQGRADQASDQVSNTIITRDESQTLSSSKPEDKPITFVSTEPTVRIPLITDRWMPLKPVNITTADAFGANKKTYFLPETLFAEMGDAPNLLPFETFIYGRYDITMKFVVNAHKFQCGKVLVALKYDSYQADALQNSIGAALQRPHVILDLATNCEGQLEIPFRFRRAMLRNVKNDAASTGVRPSKFATVDLMILSQLNSPPGSATDMFIRPFVQIHNAEFAGMSYRVKVQMDTIGEIAAPLLKEALPTREVRGVLGSAERLLKTLGTTENRDKPTKIADQIFVPHPRLNFGNGKGLIDSRPLRNNPYAMTTFEHVKPFPDEPKTTIDIAKIWGLRSKFAWKHDAPPGSTIFTTTVDPSVRNYDDGYTGNPTPLEYITSMYAFWAGTIEYRFDFVSNAYHTGAVMISAEFNRPSKLEADGEVQSASTYTKVFHLGDQKSVTFTVPYIYDTVWRRTNTLAYQPLLEKPAVTDDLKQAALNIRADSHTTLRVRVINDLRPIPGTVQDIEVLVFWRASPNFMLHGLKQSAMYCTREQADVAPLLDNFPANSYQPINPTTRSKRSVKGAVHDVPKGIANEWNEVAAEYNHTSFTIKKDDKPVVQMDNGEKEAEDPTQDFNVGKFNLGLQTTDSQLSIKDILRRPVLLFNAVTVKANQTGYFIPLMPPSREMMYHASQTDDPWCPMIGQTPQATLMNMFRFWRGSQRYTVIVHDKPPVLYITHVPHTGTRCIGNRTIGLASNAAAVPIYACGLTTDVLVPSVNSTMVYEAPYDTENDWTLTFEEDAQRNYAWRDKGDTCAGHVVISSPVDAKVSVWWSAGDDFEIGNFYGAPHCNLDDHEYMYNDKHARVQMDFCKPTERQQSFEVYVQMDTFTAAMKSVANMGLSGIVSNIPVVGAVTVAGYRANKVISKVEDIIPDAHQAIKNIEATTQKVDNMLEVITAKVSETVANIAIKFQMIPETISIVTNIIIDVLMAWSEKSWKMVGLAIIRVVNSIFGITSTLVKYGQMIGQFLSNIFSETPRVQADEDRTKILVTAVCAIVGAIVGTHVDPNNHSSLLTKITKIFVTVQGMSYLNQAMRFISTIFDTIKDLVLATLGYADPEVHSLRGLCSNSEVINKFVTEAQVCLNEANRVMMTNPTFRLRFWLCTLRAYQIQRALIYAPRNVATPQLANLCQTVIKAAQENFVDLSCSPVRYEPFVFCMVGEPGIGKSYITQTLADLMMTSIQYDQWSGAQIYTRAPGSKFWNGYRSQPIVVYDDWLNIRSATAMEQVISELYQLKSTCAFLPEMASIEEKRISANPTVIMLMCNDAFPNDITNVASRKEAVLRRRDMVVEARLKPDFKGRLSQVASVRELLTPEQSENFEHLQFATHLKAEVPSDFKPTDYKDYIEFKQQLVERFVRYHNQEKINVRKRMEILYRQQGVSIDDVDDPFALLYSAEAAMAQVNQNAYMPSEILEQQCRQLCQIVEANYRPQQIVDEDAPQVQMDLWKVFKIAVKSAILTPSAIAKVMSYSWTQLLGFLKTLADKFAHEPIRGECQVCREDKELYYKCVNSTVDNPHTICVDCMTISQNTHGASAHHRCPVCRSEEVEILLTQGQGTFFAIAQWLVRNGTHYISPLVNFLSTGLNMIPQKAIAMITPLISLLSGDVTVVAQSLTASAASFATDSVLRDTTIWDDVQSFEPQHILLAPNLIPRFQMDNRIDEFYNLRFRDDMWEEYKAQPTSVCLHHHVLANPHSATMVYEPEVDDGRWMVTHVVSGIARYLWLEDGVCGETCAFNDMERMRSFLSEWYNVHQDVVAGKLNVIYNSPSRRNEIHFIPKLLRPAWLDAPQVQEIKLSWWEYLSETYQKHKRLIQVCMGITAAVTSMLAVKKMWDLVSPSTIQSDANYNLEARNMRTLVQPRRFQPQRLQVQSEQDETVRERIARNYMIIRSWKDGKPERMLTAVGIVGSLAMIPRHYVNYLREHRDNLTIEPAMFMNGQNNHLRIDYKICDEDIQEAGNTDVAFLRLPKSCYSFKDIRSFIQTEDDAARPYPNEAEIVLGPTRNRSQIMLKSVDLMGIEPRMKLYDVDDSSFWVTDTLKYTHSEQGACGSLVMVCGHTRPIRAMHVAGTTADIGYGVLITREMIDMAHTDMARLQYEDIELENLIDRPDAMVFDNDVKVDYLGALPKGKIPYAPTKTKIMPSLIAPVLAPTKVMPAILSSKHPQYTHEKSPLYYGAAKHGKLTIDFPRSIVNRAKEALWDRVIGPMKPGVVSPKRLSIEEAVTGFSQIPHYEPMKLDTSAGYPYQIMKKDTSKRAWVEIERNEHGEIVKCLVDASLVDNIHHQADRRRQGFIQHTLFTDTLKDERKKIHKALKPGGTRVFCASPIDHTIAMRQNFLHFTAAFMKTRFNANHAVGINAKGAEWTELFQRLTKVSFTNIVNMDYSNFGPAFNAVVSEAAVELIERWVLENVADTNANELKCLLMECINSEHVAGATVYRQYAGSPSGATITTVINSIVNLLYLLIVWDALCAERARSIHFDIFHVFFKYTACYVYGDDFIMAVADEFKDIFNTNTIRDYLATHKIAATSADKDLVDIPDFVNIWEASFLKRTFRLHDTRPQMILGPLELDSVEEIPKWIWSCADKKAATRINVESALMEAHGHGKEYFAKFKQQMNNALKRYKIEPVSTQWEELDKLWFDGEMHYPSL